MNKNPGLTSLSQETDMENKNLTYICDIIKVTKSRFPYWSGKAGCQEKVEDNSEMDVKYHYIFLPARFLTV